MSRKLGAFVDDVKPYVQDKESKLQQGDYERCIRRALVVLSRRDPRMFSRDITGDGSAYEWTLSADTWKPKFSRIKVAYYPWDDAVTVDEPPTLSTQEYKVYEKTAASGVWYFRLIGVKPSNAEKVRLTYTTHHSVTETESTLTNEDWEESIILLAASFCLNILAAAAISTQDSNINSESVSYQSRTGLYLSLAKRYAQESGLSAYIQDEQQSGAAVFVSLGRRPDPTDQLDVTYPYRGPNIR